MNACLDCLCRRMKLSALADLVQFYFVGIITPTSPHGSKNNDETGVDEIEKMTRIESTEDEVEYTRTMVVFGDSLTKVEN